MATPSQASLYIYHLPKHCSETELQHEKPFATLVYVNPDDADRARVQLNGCVFMGRKIRITRAPQPDSQAAANSNSTINSIYVRFSTTNTEKPVTVDELGRIFQAFGTVEDVSIKISSTDQLNGIQSGYAFVHYASNEQGVQSAIKAVAAMDCNTVDNVTFKVELSRNLLKQFESGKDSKPYPPPPPPSVVPSPLTRDEATLPSPSYPGQWGRQISNDSNDWRSRRVHSVGNMPPPVMVTQFSPSTRQEDGRWLGDHYQQQQQASVNSSPYGMMPNNGMPSPYLGAPSPRGSSNTSMMRPPQPPASLSLAPVGPTGYQPSPYVSSEVGMRGWPNNSPSQSPSAFYSSPGLSGGSGGMGNRSPNVNSGLLQQSLQNIPYHQGRAHRAQAVTALSTLASYTANNVASTGSFVSSSSSTFGATTASRSRTESHESFTAYNSSPYLDGDFNGGNSKLRTWSAEPGSSSPSAAFSASFSNKSFPSNPVNYSDSHANQYVKNNLQYISNANSGNSINYLGMPTDNAKDVDNFSPSTLSSIQTSGSNLAHSIWEPPMKSLSHPHQQPTAPSAVLASSCAVSRPEAASFQSFHQSSFTTSPPCFGFAFPDSLSSIDDIVDDEA
eukprot:scaffold2200_cov240-Ochromonas_danica.AAC.3